MKAFTRHRTPKNVAVDERTPDPVGEAGRADAALDVPFEAPPDAGDDFIERLGDLDRFIGGPAAPPVTWPAKPPSRNLFTRPEETATGQTPPAQQQQPQPTQRLAPQPRPHQAPAAHDTHDTSEADDFMERLGDLDRFIGGGPVAAPPAPAPAPTPTPTPTPVAAHDDAEANDFLERLGDLDRFIGGPPAPPRQS